MAINLANIVSIGGKQVSSGISSGGGINATNGMNLGTSQSLIGTTAMTIGNNAQTVAINSSDWDIDATGNMTGIGNITSNGSIIIGDAGNIGSASDPDAIAIAANGVVTFSQIPVLPANSIDSDAYVDGSIDNEHLADNAVGNAEMADDAVTYAETAGSYKSLAPLTGDADDFDDNFTGVNLYGGTYIANAEGTCVLPAVAAGMNFTIVTLGDIAVVVDPNGSDRIIHPSTGTESDGEALTNLSTGGDIIVCQYESASGWLCVSNGWTAAD